MKLKKSFFNKTIFWKNVTLYWPIWGLYTVLLIFLQPVMFWSSCYYSKYYDHYTYGDRLEDLIDVIYLDAHVYIIALMAIFTGMALFHYMYNHKSANMIHALPVDRTQLFGTNVISGILFLAVPQTISSILLAIVALCNGVSEIHYIGYWLLLVIGTDIVAMAVVNFCAMFTGHILALPVYALIVNYLSYWVYYLIYITIVSFGYGIYNLSSKAQSIASLLSPTECFSGNVGLYVNYDTMGECIGASVYGVNVLVVYLLVAVVLYIVAYLTYQKRHIEQAGEFITVGWLKPIFRFGVSMTGGFFGGMLAREFFQSIGIGCNLAGFVLLMLMIGILSYFVADMFIHKSFHVFKKKNWIQCGICSVIIVISFFGLYGMAKYYEDYQPKLAEIERATICWGYDIELEGEEASKILEIHDEILSNKEICIKEEERGNWNCEYVDIRYEMKNGEYIRRSYQLPTSYEEIDAILEKIAELEGDEEQYLTYLFGEDYEELEVFYGGWVDAPFMENVHVDSDGGIYYDYDTMDFTAEQAKEIYQAIVADVKAGTLMKYNVSSQRFHEEKYGDAGPYTEACMAIEYYSNYYDSEEYLSDYYDSGYYYDSACYYEMVEYERSYSAFVYFGPDCENIVNKLIEFGYIESADDVYWGEGIE